MKRRTFIKGAVSAAVATALPAATCSYCDGVGGYHFSWCNDVNPLKYTYNTFRVGHEWTFEGKSITTMVPKNHEFTERMVEALARSMSQTRERVAADVFNRAFGE